MKFGNCIPTSLIQRVAFLWVPAAWVKNHAKVFAVKAQTFSLFMRIGCYLSFETSIEIILWFILQIVPLLSFNL